MSRGDWSKDIWHEVMLFLWVLPVYVHYFIIFIELMAGFPSLSNESSILDILHVFSTMFCSINQI